MKHRDIFDPEADQRRFKYWMRAKAPDRSYAILFTARSGSSWLTELLTRTRRMGTPSEWFNPGLMPQSSRAKGARDLDQFVEAIRRHEIHGGLFGFEITWHQLRAVFGDAETFRGYFPDLQYFWLLRRDIVAQGVSLLKMEQTRVAHAAHSSDAEIARAEQAFRYDRGRIRHWIQHTLAAERGSEMMFARFGITPERLSYEQITRMGAQATAGHFARCLNIAGPLTGEVTDGKVTGAKVAGVKVAGGHRKIGTARNAEFAARFCAEHPDYIAALAAERAPRLAATPE